jgi:hypothetical protein
VKFRYLLLLAALPALAQAQAPTLLDAARTNDAAQALSALPVASSSRPMVIGPMPSASASWSQC